MISALIGEDSVRNEILRQKKQEEEYFKALRELRNGKIFQKSKVYYNIYHIFLFNYHYYFNI